MKTALTIAGSDSSGGAGIQADIKAMTLNGVYAMSAITAMTAQNTMGVKAISEVSDAFLCAQIDAVFEDIYPDAVKIGMIPSENLISAVADRLRYYKAKNIVLDPVMVATSGAALMKNDAVKSMVKELFPLASIVTPNIPETEVLTGMKIKCEFDMFAAAKYIGDMYGCAVLVKGGHSVNDANDVLYNSGATHIFRGKRIDNPNTHGTGCTLSSTIAAGLANGLSVIESIENAKNYLSGALAFGMNLGKGRGPLNHAFRIAELTKC